MRCRHTRIGDRAEARRVPTHRAVGRRVTSPVASKRNGRSTAIGLSGAVWIATALAACSGGSDAPATPVSSPNQPPIVDAGKSQIAQGGGVVVLSGAAVDPEGGKVSFLWRQTAGLGVTLSDPTAPVTTFEAPALIDRADLEFELVVTDSSRMPAADSTRVLIMTGYTSCAVTAPPRRLGADPGYYQKYCDANGQPVLAPYDVSDLAVEWVRYQMLEMLKRVPSAARKMIENGSRVAIKRPTDLLTDIPEYRDLYRLYPDHDWDALPGVGAVVGRPITSTSEENVLCYGTDPYRGFSVFIHEFAHSIHLIGLNAADPTFEARLRQTYETAIASGLWTNTYSAKNYYEYWAEGVGIWFDAHWSAFNRAEVVDTREELAQYDDGLYRLIRDYFTEDAIPMCPPASPAEP